jgi:hypothetical protein
MSLTLPLPKSGRARVPILTIDIPDDKAADLVDAMCSAHGWRNVELDGPRAAFAKAALVTHLRNVYRAYMQKKRAELANDGVNDDLGAA